MLETKTLLEDSKRKARNPAKRAVNRPATRTQTPLQKMPPKRPANNLAPRNLHLKSTKNLLNNQTNRSMRALPEMFLRTKVQNPATFLRKAAPITLQLKNQQISQVRKKPKSLTTPKLETTQTRMKSQMSNQTRIQMSNPIISQLSSLPTSSLPTSSLPTSSLPTSSLTTSSLPTSNPMISQLRSLKLKNPKTSNLTTSNLTTSNLTTSNLTTSSLTTSNPMISQLKNPKTSNLTTSSLTTSQKILNQMTKESKSKKVAIKEVTLDPAKLMKRSS